MTHVPDSGVTNPLGSWMLGNTDDDPARIRSRIYGLLAPLITLAHASGILTCGLLIADILPGPSIFDPRFEWITLGLLPGYAVAAYVVGVGLSAIYTRDVLSWIGRRPPNIEDRSRVLRLPLRLTLVQLVLWLGGTVLSTVAYTLRDGAMLLRVSMPLLSATLIVSAICFLAAEFACRPAAALVLQLYGPRYRRISGITARTFAAWFAGSAVPLLGLVVIAFASTTRHRYTTHDLELSITAVAIAAVSFGFVLQLLIVNSVIPPLRLLRRGMNDVAKGHLTTQVAVFDGSEVGEIQAGFNAMVQGLREREQVQELFRRHVGSQVADVAVDAGSKVVLGGEERTVAVFFIDIIGSTTMAVERPPGEVVDLLNRFFAVVVDEVHRFDGLINKFAGDAALAVFGAPADHPDPATAVLAAARSTMWRLSVEVPEFTAAVGVSLGRAVAGNVGAEERFEYTVIGDPVNSASRLSDLAKQERDRILATAATVEAAEAAEREHWDTGGKVLLRGRHEPTALARPLMLGPAH